MALAQNALSIEGELLLIDTVANTSEVVTTLGDASRDMATGLSADGHIAALHGVPVEAGVWSAADGWVDLPSPYDAGCDADNGAAFDISDDAAVVVGLMWDGCAPAAFRWTATDGVMPLEILGEAFEGSTSPPTNRATVVSGDGQIAAGFAANGALDRTPAMWRADGAGVLLDPDNVDVTGEVLSIDADGSTLAGMRGNDGFVWTEAGFVDLGRVDTAMPTDPVYPNAMSADGSLVFGGVGSEFFTIPTAFVWSSAGGTRPLQPLVEAAGVEVPEGYLFTSVLAVSDDATVIFGRAFDADFAVKSFIVRVPAGTF